MKPIRRSRESKETYRNGFSLPVEHSALGGKSAYRTKLSLQNRTRSSSISIMEKKYAIHPGWVLARDGDRHYIDFPTLVRLYGLDPKQCLNANSQQFGYSHRAEFTHLYPRRNGDYSLNEQN